MPTDVGVSVLTGGAWKRKGRADRLPGGGETPPPGGGTSPDPTLLPFADTSPWRLAIATGATFAAAGDPRNLDIADVDVNGQAWVNYGTYSHPITYASAGDPLATVTDTVHTSPAGIPPGGSWQERIPTNARIASGSDAHMHVITPDRLKVQEHFAVARQSSTAYTTTRRHEVSLTGMGIGPQNGTRAYGGSALGGLIRRSDIDPAHPSYTGAIRHPLAISLRSDQLYYNGVSEPDEGFGSMYGSDGYGLKRGYVWPATEQDYGSETGYTGAIPMGSYFAIPPGVTLASLGLASAQALMVAKAAQDYGVYVTDRAGATCFYMEDDGSAVGQSFFDALTGPSYTAADLKLIFKALRVVTNNSAATPNGGAVGAARRA